jgi:hypothetical protein
MSECEDYRALCGRLARLERTNRRWIAGAMILSLVVVGGIAAKSEDNSTVRAKHFELLDEKGNVVADLSTALAGVWFKLNGTKGGYIEMWALDDSSGMIVGGNRNDIKKIQIDSLFGMRITDHDGKELFRQPKK